jgi:hypothetical protein
VQEFCGDRYFIPQLKLGAALGAGFSMSRRRLQLLAVLPAQNGFKIIACEFHNPLTPEA